MATLLGTPVDLFVIANKLYYWLIRWQQCIPPPKTCWNWHLKHFERAMNWSRYFKNWDLYIQSPLGLTEKGFRNSELL